YLCGGSVECPGQTPSSEPTLGVRLRASGTLSVSRAFGSEKLSPSAAGALEGFDLATGATTWTHPLGTALGSFVESAGALPQVSATRFLLPAPRAGSVLLDVATGRSAPAPRGAVAWCPSSLPFQATDPYAVDGSRTIAKHLAATYYSPCDVRGHAAPAPARAPGFLGSQYGTTYGGLVIWSQRDGVHAVPID
ncbi:MAG TPA: hypothetical protein VN088_17635, partial [Nocardioides sp.]|nr:hypothetical protein [Nocardioides sp.]